jgi:hypothetical protein
VVPRAVGASCCWCATFSLVMASMPGVIGPGTNIANKIS